MAGIWVLNDQQVYELVSFEENMRWIEQAFVEFGLGQSQVFPVVREKIAKHDGIFGIKAGYLEKQEMLGFKAGGFWVGNRERGLANHQSVMLLFDPATGQPQALLSANAVTQLRTAAMGAIGCKYLARPESRVLTLVGAGRQGGNQLLATLQVLPSIEEIWICDLQTTAAEALAFKMRQQPGNYHVVDSLAEACLRADVIITATSSFRPIVLDDWIRPGTHINAVGTDTRGKQELDPKIFGRARVIVDDWKQCSYLGECQHALEAGILQEEMVQAEIGEIIRAVKQGRLSKEDITVFDMTGVAIQDLATAGYALQEAKKKGNRSEN